MDSKFIPSKFEEEIYSFWEKNNYFKPDLKAKNKKPFTIVLPPPNANANLHLGHALYGNEDIMIRYHKLLGFNTLWLPGADHAGFETQFVFEKHLKKQGKTRFDYSRKKLYKNIWNFVMENKGTMENQLRRLGFALDWSRKKFTLDKDIVLLVKKTFKKLFDDGLVYKKKAVINYCTYCGTSFSDLEVVYKEKKTSLWFIKYKLIGEKGGIVVATTRPETILGDVAIAVNPKDKRYKRLVGKKAILPIVKREIPIISELSVNPKFGTGAVKVTPAHDVTDWHTGEANNLPLINIIGLDGKMTEKVEERFVGLYPKEVRKMILKELTKENLIKKEEEYLHRVGHCYKCGRRIETLPMEQWFIKIKPLAREAKKLIISKKVNIYPKKARKTLLWWLDNFRDWNISRQIVWGIDIPAYYCKSKKEWFVSVKKPKRCPLCGTNDFVKDRDTFDTWFSSSQWPFVTLKTTKKRDFATFYPTSVMETGYDILPWWVARMLMVGYYMTKKTPFKNIFLHGMVRDKFGRKMSKSKGNVINPMEIVKKYGADALRLSLIFGVGEGNDILFNEQKTIGMRNFINKVWNIGRFLYSNERLKIKRKENNKIITNLKKEFIKEKNEYLKLMDSYQFSKALGLLYEFIWHRFADFYIEQLKGDLRNGSIGVLDILREVFFGNLKMLHPFAPFVTEAIWRKFNGNGSSILDSQL